jgi:hypothetical protein
MATKKKSKKSTKSKPASKKKAAARKPAPKKKAAKKLSAKKTTANSRKKSRRAAGSRPRQSRGLQEAARDRETLESRSGELSGDLQGLSDAERADSESVDELVEEGNAFEADAVAGVEHADDEDEREVHTHEVPEDDVPEEYRNQD